jgi:hypothetical protein
MDWSTDNIREVNHNVGPIGLGKLVLRFFHQLVKQLRVPGEDPDSSIVGQHPVGTVAPDSTHVSWRLDNEWLPVVATSLRLRLISTK